LELRQQERRNRRWRLLIIVVVAFALVGGLTLWVTRSNDALEDRQRRAERELRVGWRAIDLIALNRDYTTTAAIDDDIDGAIDLFPTATDARLFTAQFNESGVVTAAYVIESGGRRGCLRVRATGQAPPNRVEFQRSSQDC
jgi:hypothetical protein